MQWRIPSSSKEAFNENDSIPCSKTDFTSDVMSAVDHEIDGKLAGDSLELPTPNRERHQGFFPGLDKVFLIPSRVKLGEVSHVILNVAMEQRIASLFRVNGEGRAIRQSGSREPCGLSKVAPAQTQAIRIHFHLIPNRKTEKTKRVL